MSPEIIYQETKILSKKPELDVLVVAPHADDAEFFCGGTIAKLAGEGLSVGVAELTKVKYATRGDHALRMKEAAEAAQVLGLSVRFNMGFSELFNSEGHEERSALAALLRKWKPRMLLYPYKEERHPDHPSTNKLVQDVLFLSGLSKFPSGQDDPDKYTVTIPLMYEMRLEMDFNFLVDISETFEVKMKAASCYQSQLALKADPDPRFGAPTYLSNSRAYHALSSRTAYYGSMLRTAHAEPFKSRNVLGFNTLRAFFDGQISDAESFVFPRRSG